MTAGAVATTTTPTAPPALGCDKNELSLLFLDDDALAEELSRVGIASRLLLCKPIGRWCLRDSCYGNTPHINVVVYLPIDEAGRRTVGVDFRPWAVKCVPGHLVFGARHLTHLDRRGLPVYNHPEKTLYDAWKFEQQKLRAPQASKRQRVVACNSC